MAVLLSRATGNFTDASTWALVDSTSYLNSESAGAGSTTSYAASSTFTPGAITIDAIAIKQSSRVASAGGTLSVSLTTAAPTPVAGTEVTININDLSFTSSVDQDGGWIVFKFAAPVTLTAATAYAVQLKTSIIATITIFSSTGTNWSRALRTTTTQAPVAGDDLIVAGEHTGAGTGNDLTVTMNQTAATDYGSANTSTVTPALAVCKRGILSYGTTASTNYLLRVSGHAIVYNGGTLNMGTTGTPMPRNSRGVLEFDVISADGDIGLIVRNGGTFTGQGQSRTSGKTAVSCKLAADTATNLLNFSGGASVGGATHTANNALDPSGISRVAWTITDTAVSTQHYAGWTGTTVNNVTQVFSVWLARGTGTNNRYCRVCLSGAGTNPLPGNGFYVDVDLQSGTTGTVTALGTGTATSASITALGAGYIVTIIGKVANSSTTSCGVIAAANSLGGVTYTGDATQNLIYYGPQLFTASALPSADLTVDTDTGWLAGDLIAVASTTRTAADCEVLALASNAGASTLTSTMTIVNNHSGTSPTQAEIINLTRNVVVRSTSSTLMTYVSVQPGSVVDLDWVEFYYLGENATNKHGIDINGSTTLTTNFDMQYCSLHDFEDFGLYIFPFSGAILLTKLMLAYNVFWNLATVQGPGVQIFSAITPTNWTISNNILIRTGSGNGFTLSDIGGTFTNNVAVGATSIGISLSETSGLIGTFSGNVAHACGTNGVSLSQVMSGTVVSPTVWRNGSAGLNFNAAVTDLIVNDLIAFGNTSSNVNVGSVGLNFRLKSPVLNGDTTFSTGYGIQSSTNGGVSDIVVDNGDFSTVSGIKTAHTIGDIGYTGNGAEPNVILRNTKLGAATEVATPSNMTERGYISSQKHDQTAGSHVTWFRHGKVEADVAVYRTAAPSLRMTPSMAAHPITGVGTSTLNNAVVTSVQAHLFDWLVVGDWLVMNGFGNGARIIAINAGAATITMDRQSNSGGAPSGITIYRGKLPSAPQGKGFLIPANAGQTFSVGVWVRKQQENLFTYSEDYSNAAWALFSTTLTSGQTDWSGGTTASKILENVANSNHGFGRNSVVSVSSGSIYTFSFYIKGGLGRQWVYYQDGGSRNTWIDITNGVAGTTNAAHTVSVMSVGGGWYRVSIAAAPTSSAYSLSLYVATADNNTSNFVGDVTKGFLIGGLQYEYGNTAGLYQVTTSTAISGYNGYVNPRLIQRANAALGIADEVVLDTMTSGNGVWEQLTGTTTAPTGDAGVIELYVDCEGTTGWVNVDDFTVGT